MNDNRIRIWVYTDSDGHQTLVTHFPEVNLTTIAHRDRPWHTWSPPHDMEDRTPTGANNNTDMLVIGLDDE